MGGDQAIAVAGRDFDYQYWRMLFKGSVAAEWQHWNLGVTATFPSIGLFGSGSRSVDRSFVVQNGPGEVITDFQNGLSAFLQITLVDCLWRGATIREGACSARGRVVR